MSVDRRPCAGAKSHRPQPAELDAHHVRPTYLCSLLGVPKELRTVLLCSGCHDLAHHVIRHLVNSGTWGRHQLPDGLRAIVLDAWDWWQATSLESRQHERPSSRDAQLTAAVWVLSG